MEKQKQKIKLIIQQSSEEVDVADFIEDVMNFNETEKQTKNINN